MSTDSNPYKLSVELPHMPLGYRVPLIGIGTTVGGLFGFLLAALLFELMALSFSILGATAGLSSSDSTDDD